MSDLWLRFMPSLVLTLFIELTVAKCFRIRKRDLLLVVLVNILTNPAAVLLSLLSGNLKSVQLLIEVVVILVEGWYYKRYSKEIDREYLFSLTANGISYGLGFFLNCLVR
ncbi:MAG: hypothetical protein IJ409_06365 [Lachnospiraceae bacterium]|nr:hypothetical protein [Lachnospiraceae bacterium]